MPISNHLFFLGTNHILSVVMSVFTLSHTAATYLFYQHNEYTSFDKRLQKEYRGLNDPPLINTMICTMLYIVLIAPRIWSNALTLSITPILSLVLFLIELIVMLYVSHRLATPLNQNDSFPSGLVTGMINFLCPCTPVSNMGWINLSSTILIILKVVLLYPIVLFDVLPVDYKPNRFICTYNTTNERLTEFRTCQTQKLLFERVLPLTITSLIIFSIPVGFVISQLMTLSRLKSINQSVAIKLIFFKSCASNLFKCLICCCQKETDVEIEMEPQKQSIAIPLNYLSIFSIFNTSPRQNKKIEIKEGAEHDFSELKNKVVEIQQETEDGSLAVTTDERSTLPSTDQSRAIPDDDENWTIEEKSVRQKNAMEIVMSFVLNVRAVFEEVISISCK